MKKLLFALMAGGILFSAASCHKCGYCRYGGSNGNSSSVCQSSSPIPGITSDYKEAQSNCSAQGGTWVVTN
jgi:hypothetical protein